MVARLDEDGLSVIALRASQAKLVRAKPEKRGEAFRKLPAKLEGYQVTVAEIETVTGLGFGILKKTMCWPSPPRLPNAPAPSAPCPTTSSASPDGCVMHASRASLYGGHSSVG
ncbi:MAG: hypothetical protein Q8N18_26480 [Opitutaceae bacterium]|nr:hypothetical protein [Opitutaceae bacterium]